MRRTDSFLAALALAGMALSIPGTALAAGAAQSSNSGAGGNANLCQVQVSRKSSSGVFDVTRQVLDNGRCICRVSTGPRGQGGSAESALTALLQRRTCADAPLAAAAGSGGLGPLLAPLAAVGGAAAAASGGGAASP